MDFSQLVAAGWMFWWSVAGVCAIAALVMAWWAKNHKQDLLATYLGDLLVLFIVFDIANPNSKALAFSALGAIVKAGMTLMRGRKFRHERLFGAEVKG